MNINTKKKGSRKERKESERIGGDKHHVEERLQAVKYGEGGMRHQEHISAPWTVQTLVLRHGRRITSDRIAASHTFYSLYETESDAGLCLSLTALIP